MTCTSKRPSPKTVYTPHLGNILNEFFNTAVGDIVQKSDKKHFTNPAVNVIEFEDKLELQMAVPGFDKSTVTITIDDDLLKIVGQEKDKHEGNYRLREFNFSGFEKTFKLPEDIDINKIEGSFKHGVLNIILPKKEEAIPQPPRSITIK